MGDGRLMRLLLIYFKNRIFGVKSCDKIEVLYDSDTPSRLQSHQASKHQAQQQHTSVKQRAYRSKVGSVGVGPAVPFAEFRIFSAQSQQSCSWSSMTSTPSAAYASQSSPATEITKIQRSGNIYLCSAHHKDAITGSATDVFYESSYV
eukprot:scaffold25258_cov184-Skeletonema_dohrnii-CCMP3373.AAC.3